MAYEKEIKTALKNKYHANLGLSESSYEKVANILGATTDIKEEDIETLVNGSEGWLKIAQSEADIVRKTVKKPEPTPTPGGEPTPKDDETLSELEKSIAAAMTKANAPLLEKIEQLEKGNANKANGATLLNLLTEKGIDPEYYAPAIEGREFKSQEEITAFADNLAEKFSAYQQSQADKGLLTIPKPHQGKGGAEQKATDAELDALADAIMK